MAGSEGHDPLRAKLDQLISPEAKREAAVYRERYQQRQRGFDAMELSDLKETAVSALAAAAATIESVRLTRTLRRHGWTAIETERLASHFKELALDIDDVGRNDTTNMAMWFDFAGISLRVEDELKSAAHEATEVYNAYVMRKWRAL